MNIVLPIKRVQEDFSSPNGLPGKKRMVAINEEISPIILVEVVD